jgi:aldehyde:ferredoxin oxidoreductase
MSNGYAGTILKIDLSGGGIERLPTAPYAERFMGGRGIAARLYWELVPPGTAAFDPANCLIYTTGPITGFPRLAASRWQVCGKAPAMTPEAFSYANLGERWGIRLKQAGFDALAVTGKADSLVVIVIRDGEVTIANASDLKGLPAFEAADRLKERYGAESSVLGIGPAAENLVPFVTMTADDGASGSSGLGAVMGSKNLKAIVVAGNTFPAAADPARLKELCDAIVPIRVNSWKGWLGEVEGVTRSRACYGCGIGCFRQAYQHDGRRYKYFCQPIHAYPGASGDEVVMHSMRLYDKYGLDTTIIGPMNEFLMAAYQQGVLTERETGLPFSKWGGPEYIEALLDMIANRQGFGAVLAKGIAAAAKEISPAAEALAQSVVLTRANETRDYDPRLVPAAGLLYATEQRRPIQQVHELTHSLWLWLNKLRELPEGFLGTANFLWIARTFWGSQEAGDYTSWTGKARAAKMIQDRALAKESLILCDFIWPVLWVRFAEDHTGDPDLEVKVIEAVTGRAMTTAELNGIGERVFNQQRAIFERDGWGGRQGDRLLDHLHDEPLPGVFFNPQCIVPGPGGEPVSKKGNKVDRAEFEAVKDEYYELRGWNADGHPTAARLNKLGLADVAADLQRRGLAT